ncbi:MAG: response regulator, partial [Chitinispirillaceae bacterium]|nr:response regulator [Chitinispirillaceae bacterium]
RNPPSGTSFFSKLQLDLQPGKVEGTFSTPRFQRIPGGETFMSENVRKVLLIDDEDAVLFTFTILFDEPDIVIHTARTFNEALTLLQKNVYDVVITDLWLNGTARFEGLDVITTVAEYQQNCKIIVLTAYGDDIIKSYILSRGASFYLEKPVAPQTLKKLIVASDCSPFIPD